MKESLGDKQRLLHILEAIEQIDDFTRAIDETEWNNNIMLRLAVSKLIENIGEAATLISDDLKAEFPFVEWPILKGIRNILVHEYFGIDYDVLWGAVTQNLPGLRQSISNILARKFTS